MSAPSQPLALKNVEKPGIGEQQLLLRVTACGICRTDLHVVDGDLKHPQLPLIPGHQIVGRVEAVGTEARGFSIGQRVGVPWLGRTCGHCIYCTENRENLCDHALYTGYQINGGFAEYAAADARFCFPLPEGYDDCQAAPLLCAGLIGYRAYRMAGRCRSIGFYGFGAAAHILAQVARAADQDVYAFTRAGDRETQAFARELGATWAGASFDSPPQPLEAAIIVAPVGDRVPAALRAVRKGGRVICAGIHMSDIPSFPYDILWEEREIASVANLTRRDGEEFLPLAATIPVHTTVSTYALEDANQALDDLRHGRFNGAAVLLPGQRNEPDSRETD